jgi:hypothetical protein
MLFQKGAFLKFLGKIMYKGYILSNQKLKWVPFSPVTTRKGSNFEAHFDTQFDTKCQGLHVLSTLSAEWSTGDRHCICEGL